MVASACLDLQPQEALPWKHFHVAVAILALLFPYVTLPCLLVMTHVALAKPAVLSARVNTLPDPTAAPASLTIP